jgi:hypothetical protein
VLFALVGSLIVGAIVIQSTKDAMRNNREIAQKTNAFLQRIEERQAGIEARQAAIEKEEKERLIGDAEYLQEFRNAVNTLYQAEQKRLSGDSEYIKEFRSTVTLRTEFQATVLLYLDRLEQLIVGRVSSDYPFVRPNPPKPDQP